MESRGSRLPARLALAALLVTAAVMLPSQLQFVARSLPTIALWPQPVAQARQHLGGVPYDLLLAAHRLLPREATVVLVTSGADVRHREYTTFHRALYYLTPRPVWWMAPAPPDGTWESRWWRSAPLAPESIRAFAAEQGAAYVLALDVPDAATIGATIARSGGGALVRIDGRASDGAPPAARPEHAAVSWPLRLALALALVLALGYGALRLAARLGYQGHGVEALALAWPLGAGITSIGMLWLNAARLDLGAQVGALAALALAGLALAWRQGDREARRPGDKATGRAENRSVGTQHAVPGAAAAVVATALLLLLAAQLALVATLAVGQPLEGWDAWSSWIMRARTIWLEDGITPAVYADPSRSSTLPSYPLLIPLLDAWIFFWLGAPDDRLVGVTAVFFHLSLAGVCYGALLRRGAAGTLALAGAVAAASLPSMVLLSSFVFVDVPLAVLLAIAAVFTLEWLDRGRGGDLLIAALGVGLLGWTKREGLVLAALLCGAALLAARRSRRGRLATLALGASAALLALPWWLFVARYGHAGADFAPLSPAELAANLSRLPTIVRMSLAELLSPQWAFVWPLAAGLLILTLVRARAGPARRAILLPWLAATYLGLMCASYLASSFAPYEAHIRSSLWRLAAHVAPLAVIWLAIEGIEGGSEAQMAERDSPVA